jgi:ParB-like chromosome segregation protein Spo0J
MTTITADTCLPTAQIALAANVRELDPVHVDALAGSIALRGVIVPPSCVPPFVSSPGGGRFAAALKLGLTEVPVV